MAEDRTLDLLLEDVQNEGKKLTSWLHENSFYQPCFRPGGLGEFPNDMPPEIQESRRKLMAAAKAVEDLAAGPADYMRNYLWTVRDSRTRKITAIDRPKHSTTITQRSTSLSTMKFHKLYLL